MAKQITLKDGTEVLIRELGTDDLDRSLAFFKALPPEDRIYLRNDVTSRDVVEQRLQTARARGVERLVMIVDDQIVADGSLESDGYRWKNHVAELRLIVARDYQRRSLGMILARELYLLAASKRVEEIVVKFMAPQTGARKIVGKLGFREEAVLPDYVKDIDGEKHDLIIMRCQLQQLMGEMEHYFAETDWQRSR
jgi:L-amino acid N-acyltransferase YncA